MIGIADVAGWLQEHLLREGLALNRQKSRVLLPGRFGLESLLQDQRSVLEATGLTGAREGMRVVSVPIRTRDYERSYIGDSMRGETAALVHALVPLRDA